MRDIRETKNVLIAGGGLAGLCAAVALRQAGCQVSLVEAEPKLQALGAGLSMNGASLRALGQLGVLDKVVAEGFCHDVRRLFKADGTLDFTSDSKRIFGKDVPNGGAILRPVLHRILQDRAVALGVNIRTGLRVEGATDIAGGSVRLSTGQIESYDLVVGADGFHSTLRHQLFPDAPESRFTGQGCWRAVVSRPADVTGACTFVGNHKVGVNPVSQAQMYMFLLENLEEDVWVPQDQWLPKLKGLLDGFGGIIAGVRAELSEQSHINYRPLRAHVVPDPWYRGRFLLIGDAVHATTPHAAYGAGLAFEDAIVLGELIGAGLPLDDVFRRFMERRFNKCQAVVNGSLHIGEVEIHHGSVDEYRAAWDAVQSAVLQPV